MYVGLPDGIIVIPAKLKIIGHEISVELADEFLKIT